MEVEITCLWDRILRDGMLQKEKAIEDGDYSEAVMKLAALVDVSPQPESEVPR